MTGVWLPMEMLVTLPVPVPEKKPLPEMLTVLYPEAYPAEGVTEFTAGLTESRNIFWVEVRFVPPRDWTLTL